MSVRRPVAPFALIYLSAFAMAAIGHVLWHPAVLMARVMGWVGMIGAGAACVWLLTHRGVVDRWQVWCGVAGAAVLVVVQVISIVLGPDDASIGLGALILLGWVLFSIGALAECPADLPPEPSARR